MKTIIRQWLCKHKNTDWISSKETFIESIKLKKPKLVRSISWFVCKDCDKFIKMDTGELK